MPTPTTIIQNDTIVQDSVAFELGNTSKIPVRKVKVNTTKLLKQDQKISFQPTINVAVNTTWPSIILTISVLILAFIRAFGINRFNQIYKSLFSYYSANEVVRDEKVFFHRVNLGLFLIFLFTTSLLIYSVSIRYGRLDVGLLLFLQIVGLVILSYALKFLFNALLAIIFSQVEILPSYSYNLLLYNYLLGLLLIPAIALMYFSHIASHTILFYIIIPLILISLIIRFMRFFVMGISFKVSFLYIILYICTLEILPLVVLGKFFIFK